MMMMMLLGYPTSQPSGVLCVRVQGACVYELGVYTMRCDLSIQVKRVSRVLGTNELINSQIVETLWRLFPCDD